MMQLVDGQVLLCAMLMANETPEEGFRKNIYIPKVEGERIYKGYFST